MTKKVAKVGDNILEHLTTDFVNEVNKRLGMVATKSPTFYPPSPVIVKGQAETAIGMYEPVVITGPVLPNAMSANDLEYNEYYQRVPICSVSTSLDNQRLAVPQQYIGPNQTADCVVMGLTWVKANFTDLDHVWLDASSGSLVSSASTGKAYIITPPQSTGVGYGLALLGMMPSTIQTVITQLQVTATSVQYKERDIYCHFASEESAWLNLASVACPEIP